MSIEHDSRATNSSSRVVLITGGTRGIGLAVAEAFAKLGDIVAISGGRDSEALEVSLKRLNLINPLATGRLVDVRDSGAVTNWINEIIQRFGRIDVAIANAGVLMPSSFVDITEEQWDEVIETHLKGTFLFLQSVTRAMIQRKIAGSLITVTAPSALRGGIGVADYASAKGGIVALTRCMAKELGAFGIRVNSILPVAETRMVESLRLFRGIDSDTWNKRHFGGKTPRPQDITGTFLFLASDLSKHVTGQVIAVDDGSTI